MQFMPGAITLDMIIGGTLQVGEIPNARLETELTALADALTAGGVVPHAHLTPYLSTLGAALTSGGKVPHANLTDYLATLAAALTAGGKVPHANLTDYLATLAPALTAGGIVPHAKLTAYLSTLGPALTAGGIVPNANLTPSLEMLADTLYSTGKIPYAQLALYETAQSNPGNVTITSSVTPILDVGMANLSIGDKFIIGGRVMCQKGGVSGDTEIWFTQYSGTGTIVFYNTIDRISNSMPLHDANEYWTCCLFGIGTVTVAGSIYIRLAGRSQGSNSVISIGHAQTNYWLLRGA